MKCRTLSTGGGKGIHRPPVRVKCGPGTYGLLTCPCRFESYSVHERKEAMREFKIGDRVTWSGRGYINRGTIVEEAHLRGYEVLCDRREKVYLIPTPRLLPETVCKE